MTDAIYFDTDCLSSFLSVKEQRILLKLFAGRIHIPYPVYEELSYPGVKHFKMEIDSLVQKGLVSIDKFEPGSEEEEVYYRLAHNPEQGKKEIGAGEASAIAFAKTYDGTLASNNFSDIKQYISLYKLKSIATATILTKANTEGLVTEFEANEIWYHMRKRKLKLPFETFSEYKCSVK
jgi:predicted nucleic acid-binding protein